MSALELAREDRDDLLRTASVAYPAASQIDLVFIVLRELQASVLGSTFEMPRGALCLALLLRDLFDLAHFSQQAGDNPQAVGIDARAAAALRPDSPELPNHHPAVNGSWQKPARP
jgi:hypothetical protein